MLRIIVVALVSAFLPRPVIAQTSIPEVAQKVRNYRVANEDSIIRAKLIDLLSDSQSCHRHTQYSEERGTAFKNASSARNRDKAATDRRASARWYSEA